MPAVRTAYLYVASMYSPHVQSQGWSCLFLFIQDSIESAKTSNAYSNIVGVLKSNVVVPTGCLKRHMVFTHRPFYVVMAVYILGHKFICVHNE